LTGGNEETTKGDEYHAHPANRRQALAQKQAAEKRDQHDAQFINGSNLRGIAQLQRAKITKP
jgi:hypothetical protein